MHTCKDDYLINTLRFVSAKEATQIYGDVLPESLTSPEMKETKAYKTYLVSPKEPTGKLKRVKRPAKKSTKALARGVVIRETLEMPLYKKKEKVDVARGKGIELLFDMALTEEAQYEEVRRKSMRNFYKTHSSGSGTVTKTSPSVAKIKPSVTNKGTGVKPGVPGATEEESSESKAKSWGNDEDDSNNEQDSSGEDSDQDNDSDYVKTQSDNENKSNSEHETDENELGSESNQEENEEDEDDEEEVKDELVKTQSSDSDDEDEIKITDKVEGYEDEEMDYTTSQLYDDMDILLNEPKIEVPVTSSSHSSDLASKFLNFLDIPRTDAEIVSPMDVHVHHVVPSQVTTLEKKFVELKKDPLKTQVTALVDEYLNARLDVTRDEFMSHLSASITARITEQVKNQLPQILPKEVVLAKESSQPQSSYEVAAMLTEFKLKRILIDKMDKSESYLAAPEHRECYEGLIKSYDLDKTIFSTYGKVYFLKRSRKDKDKDEDPSAGLDRGLKKRKTSKDAEPTKEESEFEVADSDMLQDQEEKPGNDDEEPKEKVASKHDWFTKPTQPQEPIDRDWNKALSGKLDWENPENGDYPFDLTKPLPLVISENRQKVPVDYFFNNDLKYLQGGVSTMTYTTSITKTKVDQYDLLGIEDMVPNIWVPVKVVYDKHAL
ncbi:hypothetical protein Tco_1262788 [Tanacetum coccineum]